MCGLLRHRGPDEDGTFVDGLAGLAMTRLKIIDLVSGSQPISNEDGRVTVVFNGEIYNYRELRRDLRAKGHYFRSLSDTEVLVHLYEEFGADCVHKLRGVFAFAIWDGGTLFLARDRLGVKPLYYSWVGDRFYFASEIKSLLVAPGVKREADAEALADFVTLQYVPGPKTLFKGIFKLPPAHWMRVNWRGAWVGRYWDLPVAGPDAERSFAAAAEDVDELVAEAVKTRTVADVPFGILLSGGLDSSVVAAMLRQSVSGRLKAYHIKFAGEEGEAVYARAVADALDYDYRELEATPDDLADIPKVIWHLDEPIADAAAWATYLICRRAKADVSVLLTGEGGDEVFAGYPRYMLSRLADFYHYGPSGLKRLSARVAGNAAERKPDSRFWRYAAKLAQSSPEPWERNFAWLSIFAEADRRALFSGDLLRDLRGVRARVLYERYFATGGRGAVQRLTSADMKTWLADDVLMKVDKASMGVAVEARVPLLDHVLVESVTCLPDKVRFGAGKPKRLLKQLGARLLPPEVVRRPKRAFEVPVDKWLRRYRRDWLLDTVRSPEALSRGYFNPRALDDLCRNYVDEGARGKQVWTLFCLELWFREFIDRFSPHHAKAEAVPCAIYS
jgi:asparagine synthase (glutamine-hydrolysing)